MTDLQRVTTPRYVCRKHVDCSLDTDQPALFEEHVKAKGHGFHRAVVEAWKRLPKRLWSPPRLTDEGKPFAPTGLEPGAQVTWKQLVPNGESYFDEELNCHVVSTVTIERTGQVWSGYGSRRAWVVPDELLHEREVAVLVQQDNAFPYEIRERETW